MYTHLPLYTLTIASDPEEDNRPNWKRQQWILLLVLVMEAFMA